MIIQIAKLTQKTRTAKEHTQTRAARHHLTAKRYSKSLNLTFTTNARRMVISYATENRAIDVGRSS